METNAPHKIELLQVLGSIAPLSAAYQKRLKDQLLEENYPARELVLRPGDICRRIYFISSGMVRIYSLDEMGRERTHLFMGPGEVAIDVASFYDQIPATEYLETLQPTTIQSISWNELNSFYADFKEGNYIGRLMTQKYLTIAVRRNKELLTATAQERYHSLMRQYPDIEQFTTQSHLASYLGISRETLSRLKSELLRTG